MIVLSDLPFLEAGLKTLKNPDLKLFTQFDQILSVFDSFGSDPCILIDREEETILPIIHLIKKLRGELPLYIVSRRKDDISFVTELLKAKVDDLFFYENDDEVVPLLQLISKGIQHSMARNIAFVGSGTGTTFCLLNTAFVLKRLYPNLKIGIVDCDYYKDDVLLRLDPQNRKPLTINDLLIDSIEEKSWNIETLFSFNQIANLLIVPSGGQSYYHTDSLGMEEQYLKLLTSISMQNDITFFNIGTSLNDFSTMALRLADKTCMTVTQEPIPIQVLLNLLPLFKELNRSKSVELILNRYRKDNRAVTAEMIESVFGEKISLKIPDAPAIAFRSELERRPIDSVNGGELFPPFKELAEKIISELVISKGVS